jgi:GNAT superfamily N-acetyltransferase
VGFRSGTDAELTALHAVEAPIEAERGSNIMPQPVEFYIAFARNLPSQFDDHARLAETADATPVAAGFCWSNAAGDSRVMECDVLVRRDRRREGIGSQLFARICDETANEGRSLLTWSTFDAVPAGDAFSRRLGARVARVNRTSELCLTDVDWPMIEDWEQAGRARERGYRLEMIDGAFPEHLRADAATFHHIMQTAPRENLDIGDVLRDPDDIAELDHALLAAGRDRWTALVRDSTGACVGGTEVTSSRGNRPSSGNRTLESTQRTEGWGSPSGLRLRCSRGSGTSAARCNGSAPTTPSRTAPCSRSTTLSGST